MDGSNLRPLEAALVQVTAGVEREGVCECHTEPLDGNHGLEGYCRGGRYRFQVCVGSKVGRYVRVCHNDPAAPGYYETCGPDVFMRYFCEVTDG